MKQILLLLLLILFGCSKTSTNPEVAFIEVKESVLQRTGETICWDNKTDPNFQEWLSNTLKNDLALDQVLQISLLNNPKLKAIYEKLGIAQAQLVQAGLLKNPIFDLSLRYKGSANIIEMGLVQNFLDILLKHKQKKLAKADLEVAKTEVTIQIIDTIFEIKTAYYSLQFLQQSSTAVRDFAKASELAYDFSQRLHQAGNISNLALTTERSKYEHSKTAVALSELELFEAREKLNTLMGLLGHQNIWKLSIDLESIPHEEPNLKDIEEQALANSLDLKIAREKMFSVALKYGIETTEIVFPELSLGPDSERSEGAWFVGPKLSIGIPLFDIGKAKNAEQQAELSRQWHEYASLIIEIHSTARLAHARLSYNIKQYHLSAETFVPLAKEVSKETLLHVNAMQLGVFDLLHAKQEELESSIEEASYYKDYWIAHTRLETLLNGRMPL